MVKRYCMNGAALLEHSRHNVECAFPYAQCGRSQEEESTQILLFGHQRPVAVLLERVRFLGLRSSTYFKNNLKKYSVFHTSRQYILSVPIKLLTCTCIVQIIGQMMKVLL